MNGLKSSNPVEIRHGSGTTAVIHTGYGFNCTSFSVATPDGPVEVIWSVPDFGPDRPPMLSGIPVAPRRGRPGVRWVRALTDVPTVIGEMRAGRLSPRAYVSSLRGPIEYAYRGRTLCVNHWVRETSE